MQVAGMPGYHFTAHGGKPRTRVVMAAQRATFLELETDPQTKTAQLAEAALNAIDKGEEVSVLSNNTYVIKKPAPRVKIPEPSLRTVYDEAREKIEAPTTKNPALDTIDPALISYAERLINSNTLVMFTSSECGSNCSDLLQLVKEVSVG